MAKETTMTARDILIALSVGHSGDWPAIYADVSARKEVDRDEVASISRGIGGKAITILDGNYPKQLVDKGQRPPFVLYFDGDADLLRTPRERILCVAGAKQPSELALAHAAFMGCECAKRGIVLCAKPSRGIGMAALRACAGEGGKCIAVLSFGLDSPYPKRECAEVLAKVIAAGGVAITEYPNGTHARAEAFVASGRIVGCMGKALYVPEAKRNSGTMTTVSFALAAGADVGVMPVSADRVDVVNNLLIKRGAALVDDAAEFVAEEYEDACE